MKIVTVFRCFLLAIVCMGWTIIGVQAQVFKDDFSGSTIDASKWNITLQEAGPTYSIDTGEGALKFEQADVVPHSDWGKWFIATTQPFARSQDGHPLQVTFDTRHNTSAMNMVGLSRDPPSYDNMTYLFNTCCPDSNNLFPLAWTTVEEEWAPSVPDLVNDDEWISLRITLGVTEGATFYYHDGNDWVELSDGTTTESSDASYYFVLANALRFDPPAGQPGIAMLDNVIVEYLGAGPQVADINLFGWPYTVGDPIDLQTADFMGTDPIYTDMGGQSLDFKEGATAAEDRLYLADETGAGGENAAFLTGADPNTYEFRPDVATLDYIAIVPGQDLNNAGIVWVRDETTPGGMNDENVRMAFMNTDGSLGDLNMTGALDRNDYDGAGVHFTIWEPANFTELDGMTGFERVNASTPDVPGAPTKFYFGGVKLDDSDRHFAYQVLDAASGDFINGDAVLLDNQIGMAGTDPRAAGREFRGLASDGNYFYATVLEPGTDGPSVGEGEGETWIYRFDDLPDPTSGGDTQHPASAGEVPSSHLDVPGTLDYPETAGDEIDKQRFGITCGRVLDINGDPRPVFYVLLHHYLYTLVPLQVVNDTEYWHFYR